MNKKFSTLVAALFAAGALTTASAQITPTNGAFVQMQNTHWYYPATTGGGSWVAASATPGWTTVNLGMTVIGGKVAVAPVTPGSLSKDALWKVETQVVNIGTTAYTFYRFVNANGEVLKIDKSTKKQPLAGAVAANIVEWFGIDSSTTLSISDIYYEDATGKNYLIWGATAGTQSAYIEASTTPASTANSALGWDVVSLANTDVDLAKLNTYYSDGFSLVAKKADATQDVEANPLLGKTLYAVKNAGKTYLRVSGSWDGTTTPSVTDPKFTRSTFVAVDGASRNVPTLNLNGYGYQLKVVEGLELISGDAKKTPLKNAQFTIQYAPSCGVGIENQTDSLIITAAPKFVAADGTYSVSAAGVAGSDVRIQMHVQSGKNVITTYLNEDAGTQGSVAANSEWVKFTLGKASSVVAWNHFNGKAWNVYSLTDKKEVLGILEPTATSLSYSSVYYLSGSFTKEDYVLASKPEGQWVINAKDANSEITFYNRETGSTITPRVAIYNEGNDIYTINNKLYKIVEAPKFDDARMGGYAHGAQFDRAALAQTAYRLGVMNNPSGSEAYIQAVGANGTDLEFNIKSEEGLAFYLVPTDTVAYGIGADRKLTTKISGVERDVYVFRNGGYNYVNEAGIDSLIRVSYILQDRVSKNYLNADGSSLVYKDYATRFYLKEKNDGNYVLVEADRRLYSEKTAYGDYADAKYYYDYKATPLKAVVNVTTGKFVWTNIYENNLADEFTFTMAESPKYAYFLEPAKADNDTAFVNVNLNSVQNTSWMLTYNANNELVEGVAGGEEVEGVADHKGGLEYADNTFALAIDTAYVNRVNNTMPLYYIAQQGAVRGEDLLEHPNATHVCDHWMTNDTVIGKYLFVMEDSLASKKNAATYKYSYAGNTYTRLFFVDAKRTKDQIIVLKNDGKEGDKFAETDLKKNRALFAFEVNPANEEEYAIYNPSTGKYVAYLNGNVVMKAEPSYYTRSMKATGQDVTANEAVAAEVSVVAAQGAIIVKGAAGKVVTVANILGQTIANQVAASDNVTIAAPAGIAVVTVDGEATKVVVK